MDSEIQMYLEDTIKNYHIITCYIINGTHFDIGVGGIDKNDIICLPACLSVYDSGTWIDYPYHSIIKIKKYGERI